MKRILLLALSFVAAFYSRAQTGVQYDTLYRVDLQNQNVAATHKWANDTLRYRYNQMRFYVTTILPYLREASLLFNEMNEKLNDPELKGNPRRRYIREKEAYVKSRFEDRIKSLNETQGVLLIKLIARQTGLNIYHSVGEFGGTLMAVKWQAWARLHGFNLNRKYDPQDEPELENIMRGLGYPLPVAYGGDGY